MANAELNRFAAFCKGLTLPNGKPMVLEPFQRLMLRDYFAGVRELVILVPKKNGKTSLLAALALHHLLTTDDADCVIVANSSLQAMKLFDEAKGFVQRNEELGKQVRVLRGYKEIRRRDSEQPDNPKAFVGTIKVLAADADTADGWGGTLALFDELHRAKDGELYGVLFDGLGPRAGQLITISTAGDNEDSPLGSIRRKAYELDVARDGAYRYVTTGAFSLHEWALEPTDNREDLDLVKTANPASWMTKQLLSERRNSLGMTEHRWARFACGVWGLGGEPAFDRDVWDSLPAVDHPEAGRQITLGFDGSRKRDGTALVGCDVETGQLFVLGYWQRPPDAPDDWEVPEDEVDQAVDYAFDRWDVWRLYGDPPWWESALDRWAGKHGQKKVIRWWTNRIKAMALALRAFRNDMRPDEMSHDGDETFARHIGNAIRQETRMVEDDEALWVIRKNGRDSPDKIDLAVAAALAWEARGDAIAAGAGAASTVYFG
jgi:phage terminase large subunit-like protein